MSGIDLNSDIGESFGRWTLGDDAAILQSISSANIACGYHAGDPTTIAETCRAAVERRVEIGAHPSYRDFAGFGRRFIEVPPRELTHEVIAQIGTLSALASVEGGSVRYVKPHGALYNACAVNREQAEAVVNAVRSVDSTLPIVVPPDSVILEIAEAAGLRAVIEAFADRHYLPDGRLVPRSDPRAVITDPAEVVERVNRLLEGYVVAVDGTRIDLRAETVCLHGDTAGAVELATSVRSALDEAGIRVESFVNA